MKLAVVGCRKWTNPLTAETLVKDFLRTHLTKYEPTEIISGGAEGVDTWAEEVADELVIPKAIILPKNPRWAPDGYRDRNILIAERCTHLLSLRCVPQVCVVNGTRGSEWTADVAGMRGKTVMRRYINDRVDRANTHLAD